MRIVGSGLVVAAYFITLHLNVVTGIVVHLTAMTILVPCFIKSKGWDVVIMMTFLMFKEQEGLLQRQYKSSNYSITRVVL